MKIPQKTAAMTVAVVASLLAMLPCLWNDWVNWDDHGYVLNNPLVKSLSWDNTVEIFTTLEVVGMYHPLTLISLGIDHAIGGQQAFIYHLTNLVLHLFNVLLVFGLINRLQKRIDVAVIVAILFGLHPMHVESVAWISARKDVLYTLFFLGSLIFYWQYLTSTSRKRLYYALSILFFTLALLSKIMAVVLPVLLLLMDYYIKRKSSIRLLVEKLPLFALSLGFILIGLFSQGEAEAINQLSTRSVWQIPLLASHSYFAYILKAFVPYHLSPFYPYPVDFLTDFPVSMGLSVIPVMFLLFIVWRYWKTSRPFVFGIGFFSICISFTLQFIPIGRAMMAERYTYIAYIGIFFLIAQAWVFLWNQLEESVLNKWILITGTAILCFVFGLMSFKRCQIWQNGETLWTEVIKKYPDHGFGYVNLADYWKTEGDREKELHFLQQSIVHQPTFIDAYLERGRLFQKLGKADSAMIDFSYIIDNNPNYYKAYLNRSIVYYQQGNPTAALADLDRITQIKADYLQAYINKGVIYEQMEDLSKAEQSYTNGISVIPDEAVLFRYRGLVRYRQQNVKGAMADFDQAIKLNPNYAQAYYLRSQLKAEFNELDAALEDVLKAKELGYKVDESYLKRLEGE